MTLSEICDLLSVIGAFDRRALGDADGHSWHAAIGDLDYEDARQAVIAHYSESTEWIMPGHVRQRVMEPRLRRLRDTEIPPPPPELTDDPDAYRQWLRTATKVVAAGGTPEQAAKAAIKSTRRRLQLTAVPEDAS
jgi:hypothetical protein